MWRGISKSGELYVRECPEFTLVEEFKQIISAVAREYGDQLTLSHLTTFLDIPFDLVATLREAARPVSSWRVGTSSMWVVPRKVF